jgi:hypothetical protein
LRAGYRASAMLTSVGRDAVAKARRSGQVIRQRLVNDLHEPEEFSIECLGSGDAAGAILGRREDLTETVLRIGVRDSDRKLVEHFTRLIVPLVTSGPQGTTGYFDGRPTVREVFEYWPCFVRRDLVTPRTEILSV